VQAAAYVSVHDANRRARAAAGQLRTLPRSIKDKALTALAEALIGYRAELLAANRADLASGQHSDARQDRLALTERRLESLADSLLATAAAPDPLGEVLRGSRQRSGVQLSQVRVPIGVVAVLYEDDPSVIVRATALLLKAGNALLLDSYRSEVPHTEDALVRVVRDVLETHGVPADAARLLPSKGRATMRHLLTSNREVDLVIPLLARGVPPQLMAEASVPVAEVGPGNCHVYVDAAADLDQATEVVLASKVNHQTLSNSAETVLVHAAVADRFVPSLIAALREHRVTVRGDARVVALTRTYGLGCGEATETDWHADFRGPELACAVVDSLGAAIAHIERHGTGHTETVVTADQDVATAFTARVDAATITVNTPTTFAHAAANPIAPELAYSTYRLHPRGPLDLSELTTTKWVAWPARQAFSPLERSDRPLPALPRQRSADADEAPSSNRHVLSRPRHRRP
jgi:glutamate-5-semialdehyde dehydrogenase